MADAVQSRIGPFTGPDVEQPEKLSQSFMSRFDVCPFSAALYVQHKGGPQSPAMIRGELFHRFVQESVEYLRDEGEIALPPEIAKDRMMALIEASDTHLPEFEQDACRLMAWNWGSATAIDPDNIVGIEEMLEIEVAGFTLRGKLDFAEIGPFGALVRDYKTSLAPISQDDAENAKSYQGRFYALLLLFGKPEGEDLSLGTGLNEVRVEITYPRWTNDQTGELLGREVTWTRDQLADFRRGIEGHLAEIAESFETGEWHAQSGSHCSECAAQSQCPLPDHVVPAARIGSVEEAQASALAWHLGARVNEPVKAGVKAFCETEGLQALPYDADYELAFVPRSRREVDWKAVGDGPVKPEHIKPVDYVEFAKRKRKDKVNGSG